MARIKVNYTEPIYSSNELEIAEIITGSKYNSKELNKDLIDDRYGKRFLLDASDKYAYFGVSYNAKSINAQLGYYPEYKEVDEFKLKRLTFTPPLKKMEFLGKYDFYNGDKFGSFALKDFPFGFIVGLSEYAMCGYNGSYDALVIGGNGLGELNNKKIGKNIHNYNDYNQNDEPIYKSKEDDGFYALLLDSSLRTTNIFRYKKAPYPLYKMSFYYADMFLLNYDYHKFKFAVIKNDSAIFSTDLEPFERLRFFRTHKFDLAYSNKRFILLDKRTSKVIHQKIDESFTNLSFNPVLKSICIKNNALFKVFKIYPNAINIIHDWQQLSPIISKYAIGWMGNLEFDYMIDDIFNEPKLSQYAKTLGYRGHYPYLELRSPQADYKIGKFTKCIKHSLGDYRDFCLNSTDDADLGRDEFLINRRKLQNFNGVNIASMSYARFYKGNKKRICFYSTDFHNNFGELYLFEC